MPCENCYHSGYNQGYENGCRDTNRAYSNRMYEIHERLNEIMAEQEDLHTQLKVQEWESAEAIKKAYQRGFEDGSMSFNKPSEHL